jgi:hypothetical protein
MPAKIRAIITRATQTGNDEIRMILLAIEFSSDKSCVYICGVLTGVYSNL